MNRLTRWLGCDCRNVWCYLDGIQHRLELLSGWTPWVLPISRRICDRHDDVITGETEETP